MIPVVKIRDHLGKALLDSFALLFLSSVNAWFMLFYSSDEQVWREVNASCTNGSRIDWPTFTIAAQVKKEDYLMSIALCLCLHGCGREHDILVCIGMKIG